MAQDHSVLGLQLLFSFLSSSSNSPKWCVHDCVLDLLGRAVPMELLFFFPTRNCLWHGFGYVFSKQAQNWDFIGITEIVLEARKSRLAFFF